jgi:hypothetical protein
MPCWSQQVNQRVCGRLGSISRRATASSNTRNRATCALPAYLACHTALSPSGRVRVVGRLHQDTSGSRADGVRCVGGGRAVLCGRSGIISSRLPVPLSVVFSMSHHIIPATASEGKRVGTDGRCSDPCRQCYTHTLILHCSWFTYPVTLARRPSRSSYAAPHCRCVPYG